jgi:hypothetical protein
MPLKSDPLSNSSNNSILREPRLKKLQLNFENKSSTPCILEFRLISYLLIVTKFAPYLVQVELASNHVVNFSRAEFIK